MVAAGAARMEVGRLQHRPDPRRRPLETLVATAEDERRASGRLDEMEQHAQRRRLAGPVRAEEARDGSTVEGEGQVIDGEEIAEALGQMVSQHDRTLGRARCY